MADKPNFVLIPDEAPPSGGSVTVFGFDATASREPAWVTAQSVTI